MLFLLSHCLYAGIVWSQCLDSIQDVMKQIRLGSKQGTKCCLPIYFVKIHTSLGSNISIDSTQCLHKDNETVKKSMSYLLAGQ